MDRFYILRGQKMLSGFYPNDISGVFAFRKYDYYSFSTEEEAQDFINSIRVEVNEPSNLQRYGKYAKQHQSIAKNLWVWKNG